MKLIMMKDICGRIKPNLPFQGDVGRYVAILPGAVPPGWIKLGFQPEAEIETNIKIAEPETRSNRGNLINK